MAAKHDSRTAVLLAERLAGSFFDGLSRSELVALLAGPGSGGTISPVFSMLSHTFDVFRESLALGEDAAREYFEQAVRAKLKQLRAHHTQGR